MKIKVNGKEIANIITNCSMTIEEAMYIHGYDINDPQDCERGYNNDVEGFYIDDYGNYCFDVENAELC